MRLSNKQALMLFDIAKGTINIIEVLGGYNSDSRLSLINEIIKQQDDEVKELETKSDNADLSKKKGE